MVNLARVLDAKGDYTDALLFLRQGLAIRERVLEEGHPDTISALAWIGVRSNIKYTGYSTRYSMPLSQDSGFE